MNHSPQANEQRLSMTYEAALAEAAAAGRAQPTKPEWTSWVARIPEHHRTPDQ